MTFNFDLDLVLHEDSEKPIHACVRRRDSGQLEASTQSDQDHTSGNLLFLYTQLIYLGSSSKSYDYLISVMRNPVLGVS